MVRKVCNTDGSVSVVRDEVRALANPRCNRRPIKTPIIANTVLGRDQAFQSTIRPMGLLEKLGLRDDPSAKLSEWLGGRLEEGLHCLALSPTPTLSR